MNEDVYDIQEGAYQIETWATYVSPDGKDYIELIMIGVSGRRYRVTAIIDLVETLSKKYGSKPIKKEVKPDGELL